MSRLPLNCTVLLGLTSSTAGLRDGMASSSGELLLQLILGKA